MFPVALIGIGHKMNIYLHVGSQDRSRNQAAGKKSTPAAMLADRGSKFEYFRSAIRLKRSAANIGNNESRRGRQIYGDRQREKEKEREREDRDRGDRDGQTTEKERERIESGRERERAENKIERFTKTERRNGNEQRKAMSMSFAYSWRF